MQMWPDLIQKAKDGGLDVIQTYVFWNGHEPSPGNVIIYLFKISIYTMMFFCHLLMFYIMLEIFSVLL